VTTSEKSTHGVSERIGSVISSQELAAGHTHSNSQAGQQIDLFGPEAAPVPRSHPQAENHVPNVAARASVFLPGLIRASKSSVAKVAAGATQDIYGLSSSASSASVDLTLSLASKLAHLLPLNGSPEYELTWREVATPQQPSIFRLRASAHRTSDKDCSGWPTAAARDWKSGKSNQHGKNSRPLNEVAELAGWQTPKTPSGGGAGGEANQRRGSTETGGPSATGRMGNTTRQRQQESRERNGEPLEPGQQAPPRPDADGSGFWSDFDLIPCGDGKSRRIESGTFPLVARVPGRVGLLRGYGNAIVPPLAAKFIKAFLEMENEC